MPLLPASLEGMQSPLRDLSGIRFLYSDASDVVGRLG